MTSIKTYDKLEDFGRMRLSPSFFMRDFLYSEIAAWHQLRNVPDHPDVAISVGRELCGQLLEPLQQSFGRIHIRSGYRSPAINDFGNKNGLNCASNESNLAAHIWDYPDAEGRHGATACIVIPWLVDHISHGGHWSDMAWWIHDHLPYSSLYFFPKLAAFNISWHETPVRRIDSYAPPKGCLTRLGMKNHEGLHAERYVGFPALVSESGAALMSRPDPTELIPAALVVPHRSTAQFVGGALAPNKRESGSSINYRAVHAKTLWRKAGNHRSLESAINGKDGAAGLFAHRVRIDYQKHGEPLYVLVWEDGATTGCVIKPDKGSSTGIRRAAVPIGILMQWEEIGRADNAELEKFF